MKIKKAPRRLLMAVVAAAMALSAGSALGGSGVSAPVTILDDDTGAGFASGNTLGVRNSANNVEYISCFLWGLPASPPNPLAGGYCHARNAAGLSRVCLLKDGMIEAAKSITAYSYIRFWYDQDGNCTMLTVESGSQHLPAN